MRIFKTREFARLVRKTDIDDRTLREAVDRAAKGLVDAELGSGLIKQRVSRKGQGKSGGYRTIIALRAGDRAFSSTASPRMTGATLLTMNCRHSARSRHPGFMRALR